MIGRREMLKGMAAAPLAGLPLSVVLASPELARAAAAGLADEELTLPSGRNVRAALAVPSQAPAPTIVLIHEWWGLNNQIKAVAAEYGKLGYLALAVDLMGGKVATTSDQARSLTQGVKPDEGTETLVSWVEWLRKHKATNNKVGTVGWCFGGGWSLNASIATPVDATVIYYGRVTRKADELRQLKGPVLGHFGTLDKFINKKMVSGFEAEMKKAGKTPTIHWYEANHGFANPTGSVYDEANTKSAWDRTNAFFADNLA